MTIRYSQSPIATDHFYKASSLPTELIVKPFASNVSETKCSITSTNDFDVYCTFTLYYGMTISDLYTPIHCRAILAARVMIAKAILDAYDHGPSEFNDLNYI